MQQQLATFKAKLEEFAAKYKKKIGHDPELRRYVHQLCSNIGVDPLVSHRGFWADKLGFGDYYYALALELIEICMRTRPLNGGFISMDQILEFLRNTPKFKQQHVSVHDIECAVGKLKVLMNSFQIIKIGPQKMLQSVPYELCTDHTSIILLAQSKSYVTHSMITSELKWLGDRAKIIIDSMMIDGLIWVDRQIENNEEQYWFPSLFFSQHITLP